jgi:hypothetical protein
MECRDVQGLADAYVSNQVLVETAQAIAVHLDGCPTCRAGVGDVRRLRSSTRKAFLGADTLQPRPEFIAALGARLRSESRRSTMATPRRGWLALAAAIVLIVGGGFGLLGVGVSGFSTIVHAAVGDHRFCAVAFKLTERPIPLAQAAQRYDDPADLALEQVELPPTALSGGPIRIVERHSCVYDGRRFAHLVFLYGHRPVSLVVTPDDRLLRGWPGASAPADGSLITLPQVDGFQVVAFRSARHLVFVIAAHSDQLSDNDAREVAGAMAPSVLHALAGE